MRYHVLSREEKGVIFSVWWHGTVFFTLGPLRQVYTHYNLQISGP